jgi:hypothetical protein
MGRRRRTNFLRIGMTLLCCDISRVCAAVRLYQAQKLRRWGGFRRRRDGRRPHGGAGSYAEPKASER